MEKQRETDQVFGEILDIIDDSWQGSEGVEYNQQQEWKSTFEHKREVKQSHINDKMESMFLRLEVWVFRALPSPHEPRETPAGSPLGHRQAQVGSNT